MVAQQRCLQKRKAEEERGFRGLWWEEIAHIVRDWVITDSHILSLSFSLSSNREYQLIPRLELNEQENVVNEKTTGIGCLLTSCLSFLVRDCDQFQETRGIDISLQAFFHSREKERKEDGGWSHLVFISPLKMQDHYGCCCSLPPEGVEPACLTCV